MKFNFDQDKDFFNQSPTFNTLVKSVKDDLMEKANQGLKACDLDEKFVYNCVKLWAETAIKHNMFMWAKFDEINLISDENSKEVIKTIGKIMFKRKDERTPEEFTKLRQQHLISNKIHLTSYAMYDNKVDIYENLKNEYEEFKNNPIVQKSSKLKSS